MTWSHRTQLIDSKGSPHSAKTWDMTFAVNVSGTFHLTRLALKHFINVPKEEADGERGVIVMVSSSVAVRDIQSPGTIVLTPFSFCSMTEQQDRLHMLPQKEPFGQ